MILGVDLSTSISGYAVIDDSGELVFNDAVDTRRVKSLYRAASENVEVIDTLEAKYDGVEHVFIEENLQTFKTGFSSAQVLSKLSKMNGIISWHFWDEHGIEPEFINPRTARKEAGLTMSRDKKEKMEQRLLREGKSESYASSKATKMVVHEFVQGTEPNFEFSWTRSDNPKPQSFDKADACIIARAAESELKSG